MDVKGQLRPRRALEIAAAGGHSLLFRGPPGTGKTLLASRLASILPPLNTQENLEVASIHCNANHPLATAISAPHHTASAIALVGGGSHPKPERSHWRIWECYFWTNCLSLTARF